MPAPVYLDYSNPQKPGRPLLLNKARQERLMSAIESGVPLKQAAMFAGICYETMNRWRKRGEAPSAPPEFRQFCQALQHSQAIAMQSLVSSIHTAGKKDWRAAAWMLERRFPEEFGRTPSAERKEEKEIVPHVDHEVLRRIKKQEAMRGALGKLGQILDEVRAKRAAAANGEKPS